MPHGPHHPHHPPHHGPRHHPHDDEEEFGFVPGPTLEDLTKVLQSEQVGYMAWQALRFAPPEMRVLATLLVALYLDGGSALPVQA